MSNKISGVVEATARSNKAFKVGEEWYSVFKPAQANGAKKGDTVEFSYKPVNKGGQTFYNIEGNITVLGSAAPAANSPLGNSGGQEVTGVSARDQQIIRQNALTQANAALTAYYGGGQEGAGFTPDQYAEHVIEIARQFEAYSKGEV